MPTQYFKITNPAIPGKPVNKGVYVYISETVFKHLRGQGKIRDLSS